MSEADSAMTMPAQKPARSRQIYGTPPAFLQAVKRRFGIDEFSIDLAADATNAVAPVYYTIEQDALVQPWRTTSRGLAWCNPPFGDMEPWVRKACEETKKGACLVMLVRGSFDTNWWRDWVHEKARVLLLNGRLTFVGERDPYPMGCCLLWYGPNVMPGYEVWEWMRGVDSEKFRLPFEASG